MKGLSAVYQRELTGYFATPVAYVFIVIFLVLAGVFTFQIGGFFQRNNADLQPFFSFHPWLYLFLVPAVSMRLWADERRTGTIELLMTLPISGMGAVLGKYLAAWTFAGAALLLTFPVWITVNYLGSPDNGAIVVGYIGSMLLAGAYLAIGSCVSAMTRSQVIAFVVSVVVCFGFLVAGLPPVMDAFAGWAPRAVAETIGGFSFLTRFDSITKGVIDARDVIFFGSLTSVCLALNVVLVGARR